MLNVTFWPRERGWRQPEWNDIRSSSIRERGLGYAQGLPLLDLWPRSVQTCGLVLHLLRTPLSSSSPVVLETCLWLLEHGVGPWIM